MRRKVLLGAVGTCVAALAGVASCVGDSNVVNDSGFDVTTNDQFVAPDTGTVDASDASDGSSPPACDLAKPFGAPTALPVPLNSAANNFDVWFLPDALSVFFSNDLSPDGGIQTLGNLYSANRASLDAGFSNVTAVKNVNNVGTGYGPVSVALTADGLTLYFSNGFTGGYTTWIGTRASTATDFTPTQLPNPVNGSGTENFPAWVNPDGGTLYFISTRTGGQGGRVIWLATRASDGGFNTPNALLSPINTTSDENAIILTPDELQAFITRGAKLYYTSRATTSGAFAAPVAVAELNSASASLSVSFVSADGCTVYFDSPSIDGGADFELYEATRGK